jgi:ABC-type cobalamin/Fe3+-siderophores transport system ATPase subunit
MTSPFRVTQLTFNSGVSVDTSEADIVVIVGPNNTGKSQTLQLSMMPGAPVSASTFFVLSDLTIERAATTEELQRWLKERRYTWTNPDDIHLQFRTANGASSI